jgi:hypothetical protein
MGPDPDPGMMAPFISVAEPHHFERYGSGSHSFPLAYLQTMGNSKINTRIASRLPLSLNDGARCGSSCGSGSATLHFRKSLFELIQYGLREGIYL